MDELKKKIDDFIKNYSESHAVKDEFWALLNEFKAQHKLLKKQADELNISKNDALQAKTGYENLFYNAPVAYVLTNAQNYIIKTNAAARELLHIKPEDQFLFTDFLNNDQKNAYKKHLELLKKSGDFSQSDLQITPLGKNKSLHVSIQTNLNDDNEYMSAITDISSEIEAKIEINSEKEISDSVIESMPGLFFMYEIQQERFIPVRHNNSLSALTGYSEKELSSISFDDLFSEVEYPKFIHAFDKLTESESAQFQAYITHKNRKEIPYIITLKKINSLNKNKKFLICTCVNISKQVFSEEKIRSFSEELAATNEELRVANDEMLQSNRRYATIESIAAEGICMHEDFVIKDVNPAMCKIFEYDRHEFIGKNLWELFPGQDRSQLLKAVDEGYRHPIEVRATTKLGNIKYLQTIGQELVWEGKNMRAVAFHDITHRKISERELMVKNRRLKSITECRNAILHTDTAELLAQKIVDIIGANLNFPLVWAALYNPQSSIIKPIAVAGDKKDFFKQNNLPCKDALLEKCPAVTGSMKKEIIIKKLKNKTKMPCGLKTDAFNFNSVCYVPLYIKDKIFGALGIYSTNERIPESDIHFLKTIGHDLAFALQSLNLHRKNEKQKEDLRDSEEMFKAIAGAAQDAVILIDDKGKVTFWNQAAEKIFGYKKHEIVGEDLHKHIAPPQYHKQHQKGFKHFIKTGKGPLINTSVEMPAFSKSRGIITAEISLSATKIQNRWYGVGLVKDITQRKREQEMLKQSEQRFRLAQKTANIGTWEWDLITDEITWSEPTFDIFGIKTVDNKISNENFLSYIHPDDRDELIGALNQAIETIDDDYKFEYRIIKPNGKTAWVFETGEVFTEPDKNKAIKMIGVLQDITKRKEAELESKKLSQVVEQSPSYIFITDLDGKIEYTNPAFTRITGYTFEDVKGQNPRVLKSGRVAQEVYEELWETILSGNVWRGEFINRHKNGKEYYENATIAPIKDHKGNIIRFFAIKDDITKIKESEKKLLETGRILKASYDSASESFFLIDRDYKILSYNKIAEKMATKIWGKKIKEGESIKKLSAPGDWESFKDAVNRAFKGEFVEKERKIDYPNGYSLWYHIKYTPVSNENNVIFAISYTSTDISKRKNAEIELLKRKEELKSINEELLAEQNIFMTGNVVVFKWKNETDWPVEYVSKNVSNVFGYTPDDFYSGKVKYAQLIHPEDLPKVENELKNAIIENKTHFEHKEYRVKNSQDKTVWLYNFTTVQSNKDGEITRFYGYIMNITDRVEAEKALRESEAKFRVLVENSQVGITLTKTNGEIVSYNKAALEIYGITDESLDLTALDFYKNREDREKLFQSLQKEKKISNYETELVHASGKSLYVSVSISLIELQGETFLLTSHLDITDKKIAEQAIKSSQERYSALFNQAPIPSVLIDLSGNIIQFNTAAYKTLQYTKEEFEKLHISDIDAYDNELAVKQRIVEIMQKGQLAFEAKHKRKDGSIIDATVTVKVIELDGKTALQALWIDVTRAKQAERKLLESEAKLREAQKIAKLGTWDYNIKTGELFWSKELFNILELPNKKITPTPELYRTYVHHDDKGRSRELYEKAVENNEPYEDVYRLFLPGKKIKYVKEQCNLQEDTDGNVVRVLGIVQDITKEQIAEKALLESEAKLREAQQIAQLGIWEHDIEKNEFYWSNEMYNLLNQTKEDIKPSFENYLSFIHPQDREMVKASYLESIRKKQTYEIDFRLSLRDGNIKYIKEQCTTSFDRIGRPIRSVGVVLDITGQKLSEINEQENKEKFRYLSETGLQLLNFFNEEEILDFVGKSLLHFIPETYILISTPDIEKNKITVQNVHFLPKNGSKKNLQKIFKKAIISKSFEIKTSLTEQFPEKQLIAHRQRISKQLSLTLTKPIVDMVTDAIDIKLFYGIGIYADKQLLAGIYILSPGAEDIQNQEFVESMIHRAGTVLNLRKNEKQIIEARKQAEEANRLKSEFLANMSHEIRTPMNAILGFANILNKKITEPEHRSYIQKINTGGNNLLHLINDILDLSKIEAGQLKLEPEPTKIKELIHETNSIFAQAAAEKGIAIIAEIDDRLPQTVIIDGLRLRQILLNLVSNAVKFTQKGKVSIKIETTEIYKNGRCDIRLTVSDTGIGIPKHEQDAVFDSFRQIEGQSTRKFGGTGLGLTIVKHLVRMLNGQIKLKSKIGKGTSFIVDLKDIYIAPDILPTESENQEEIQFSGMKVLIAEDVDYNRTLLKLIIDDQENEIREAEDGLQALEVLKTFTPDIILMDISMPKLDGYELTKRIRKNTKLKHIPVIAVTAHATSEERNKFSDTFDAYLTKPIDEAELKRIITRHTYNTKAKKRGIQKNKDENNKKELKLIIAEKKSDEKFVSFYTKQISPIIKGLQKRFSVSDLHKLIAKIDQAATDFEIKPFFHYSKMLKIYIEAFDIQKIKELIKQFKENCKEIE